MKKMQQGVALLVAMLIVAIATIVATQIFYQQQIAIRRTLNQLQAEQLYQVALSTEQFVKVILKADMNTNNFDYLGAGDLRTGDLWAKPILIPEAEGVVVKATVIDYQSCFNINNLVLNGKAQPAQIALLQNLMSQLKLDPQLVWSLVDWMDSDENPNSAGAEFETYSRLIPAYRTANYRIMELNELYAVKGWDAKIINTLSYPLSVNNSLSPAICALPPAPSLNQVGRFYKESTFTTININTASELLLRALSPDMSNANLIKILDYRKKKGYDSIASFKAQLDKDNPRQPPQIKLSVGLKNEFLSVDSHYFMLEYNGKLDQLEQNYRSLIYRQGNSATSNTNASANPPVADAGTVAAGSTQENPAATDNAAAKNTSPQPNTNSNKPANIINSSNTQINTLYRLQYY